MTGTSADILLNAQGLKKSFLRGGEVVRGVDDVDLSMARGKTLALVGESGSGKSTLGRLLARLIEADAGTVSFAGENISALKGRALRPLRRRIQLIFQDPYASLNPRLTILRAICQPMALHGTIGPQGARASAAAELARVGLPGSALSRYPHQFSGGQRQRIGIARALALRPELLICDEPVSALDVSVQAQVINLLKRLQGELGLTMLFIAHDLAVVANIADTVAVMHRGRIVEEGPVDTVLRQPRHPYTQALVAAVPRLDGVRPPCVPPIVAAGPERAAAQKAASACSYAPQCAHRSDRCFAERPQPHRLGAATVACHNAATIAPFVVTANAAAAPDRTRRIALFRAAAQSAASGG